uniref:D-amino acid oxidase n=1 Tax=Phyllozyma linderae TaxID=69979 RepID=A0A0S1TIQ7_9BASI|nr:D-amino acid oxidase [Phyllozyma linderae]
MAPAASPRVLVIGAGVVGLTTAVEIQRALPEAAVTIFAAQTAEDLKSTRYTSSWAGAHHVTLEGPGLQRDCEVDTFKALWALAHDDPSVPLLVCPQTEVFEDASKADFMRKNLSSFMPDVKPLEPSALPEGCTAGLSFTTIALDTPNYLPWLAQRFRAAGGTVVRRELGKLSDAPLDEFDAVVNCSGLGALTLVGDDSMYPIRGQTVLVRAPWIRSGITRSGSDNWTYIIPRKQGDVIVGGTRGIDDWHEQPRPETASEILARGLKLCPALLPEAKRASMRVEDIDVVEHGCGFRPARKGGVRIELDHVAAPDGRSLPLVHNYGHAGAGFQMSIGSATRAVDLLRSALAS